MNKPSGLLNQVGYIASGAAAPCPSMPNAEFSKGGRSVYKTDNCLHEFPGAFFLPKALFLTVGFVSLGLGGAGIVLPLLPTVPFLILAAFCFARSNPMLEQRLLKHPKFGPPILLWRETGAISRTGKRAALSAFAVSSAISLVLLPLPWSASPLVPALIVGTWIWRRPEQ